ncbi:hypothetical protein [Acidiluteibacter ferrifornacis]|uniref:Lipoprotein n=1 Tax=Acidiluteibacter ferrifornacis TaxID=2692424 RepID=A0A6N9NMS1_9FLAO|nr:hypothetical protein [Acidiluteibacter ferrifornacis]NBG67182.1 hypothetical protein [Acidiluteibacter ferrifornacis]
MKKLLIVFISFSSLAACVTKHEEKKEVLDDPVLIEAEVSIKELFYAVPSPMELSTLFKKAGLQFEKSYLLSHEEMSHYHESEKMALILGVYGADLSYSSIFKRTQEAMVYMSVCKDLSENLGIGTGFNEKMVMRLESNIENKDSIISIIAASFLDMDNYLKENKQSENATLVVIGGWIEGIYLGTSMIQTSESNQEIKEVIRDQYGSLKSLIKLANSQTYTSQTQIAMLLAKLESVFKTIQPTSASSGTMQQEGELLVLKQTKIQEQEIDDTAFEEINEQIKIIRNTIIQH